MPNLEFKLSCIYFKVDYKNKNKKINLNKSNKSQIFFQEFSI